MFGWLGGGGQETKVETWRRREGADKMEAEEFHEDEAGGTETLGRDEAEQQDTTEAF